MKKNIYLAGGCFWGLDKLFSMVDGVETECGFANGFDNIVPTYEKVCNERTGFKETVKITYDDEIVSLKQLLFIYFQVIDPTVRDRQGFDVGHQYQTGIYFDNPEDATEINQVILHEIYYAKHFFVEFKALENYFPADEFHQDYLKKNPNGYCHINPIRMEKIIEYINEHKDDFVYDMASREKLKIMV